MGPERRGSAQLRGNTLSLLMLYEIAVSKVKVCAKNLVSSRAASQPIEHWVLDSASGHSYPPPKPPYGRTPQKNRAQSGGCALFCWTFRSMTLVTRARCGSTYPGSRSLGVRNEHSPFYCARAEYGRLDAVLAATEDSYAELADCKPFWNWD